MEINISKTFSLLIIIQNDNFLSIMTKFVKQFNDNYKISI